MLKIGVFGIAIFFVGITFAQEIDTLDTAIPTDAEDEIHDFPDVEAQFPGDKRAYIRYIQENVVFPKEALENGDQGRVYVIFVVEKDGSITGIDVMRGGVTELLDNAAMKVVRDMPNWIPAQINGENVRSRCRLPISFTNCGWN